MRKIFSLLAAVLFAGSMMAQVTITPENSSWTSTAGAQTGTVEGVTVAVTNGITGSTSAEGATMRIYKDATLTISSASNISKIEFTCTANGTTKYGPGCFAAQDGYSYEGKVGTWIGSATSVSFTASSNQVRATQIVVTLGDAPAVAAPAIAGEANFFDSTTITITCATEGATIYYTLDGSEPNNQSTAYTAPFQLKETATVKAYAQKATDLSAVTSKTFTKAPSFASFEALIAAELPDKTIVEVSFENVKIDSFYVSSQSKKQGIYFTVGEKAYEIYYNKAEVPETWEVGGTVSGTIRGNWTVYKGIWEIVPSANDWAWALTYKADAPVVHTYTVAGAPAALFGSEWDPSDANNDMDPVLGGDLYVWRKDSVNLTAGDIEFKVCEDHSWDKVYPAQNYKLNIAEAGYYNILIRFNPKAEPDSMIIAGATKVADAPIVGVETIYNWAKDAADQVGTTILGTTGVEINTVKIHENTDAIPGIKFGSSYVYADGKWIAIKPAEGGFKAGDEISLSVVFNNSDVTKYCMADVYAADGATNLFRSDSASTLNGRNAGEPIVQTYTLASDQDSLLIGRYGNTGMFITLLKVTRALVPPTPEKTYTVVGGSAPLFGNTWDPAYEANNMEPITGSEYLYAWKKEGVALTAGTIEYKVCQDHGWATAWPAQGNYNFTIDEAGLYDVTIFFNPELETPTQVVAEFKGAVVVLPNIILHGNFTGTWADTEAFTPASDSLTASLTLALTAGTFEFGFKFDGAWKANGANFTREANTANLSTGEGNMNITADVPGNYIFTYTYETQGVVVTYPEPIIVPDTVKIVVKEDLEWTDAVAKAGWWQIVGENEGYSFSLSNSYTTEVPGIYTVEDLDETYSYVKPINGTDKIHFVSGQVVVAINTDSIITFVGALTGTDDKVYAFDLAYDPAAVNPYKYDEKDADFIYNFDSYKINTQSAAQGIVGITTNTDSTYIGMTIILPQGQTTLVAGEYPVAATPAYQTVYAGYYDNDKKSPAGSMAATLIEQGGKLYYNEIWYLVSGKATVDADLNITVDALNSNSKLIKANLKAQAQGIEDVKAAQKATKSLKNGILVIEKNGVQYNVTGQEIR